MEVMALILPADRRCHPPDHWLDRRRHPVMGFTRMEHARQGDRDACRSGRPRWSGLHDVHSRFNTGLCNGYKWPRPSHRRGLYRRRPQRSRAIRAVGLIRVHRHRPHRERHLPRLQASPSSGALLGARPSLSGAKSPKSEVVRSCRRCGRIELPPRACVRPGRPLAFGSS
jgi:hypothetical protein